MMAYVFSLMFGALHLGTAVDSPSRPMFGLFIQRDSRGVFSFLFDILPLQDVFNLNESWYGIFTQRNTLGMIMPFSALVFFLWRRLEPQEKSSAYLWASLSFAPILLSGSLPAFLGLCAILVMGSLLWDIRLHRQRARRVLVASAVMAGIGLCFTASHVGGMLYPLELILTKVFTESPTSEIVVCRKQGQEAFAK